MGQTVETVAVRIRAETGDFRRSMRETVQTIKKGAKESANAMRPMDEAVKRTKDDLDRMGQAAQQAARKAKAAALKARREITRGFSRMKGAITTALGFGGVAGAVYGIRNAQQFEQALVRLQVQGSKTASWLAKAREEILSVSNATGRSKEEVLSYMAAYVEQTGDAQTALETLRQIGEVAVATGANMEDLAGTMVKAGAAFQIAGKDVKELWNIFRQQEKLGAVDLKKLSVHFGAVAGLASRFGKAGMGLGGARALAGLMQVTATGFDPNQQIGEITTATKRFLEDLARRANDPKLFAQMVKQMGFTREEVARLGKRGPTGFQFNDLPTVFRTFAEAAARNPGRVAQYGSTLFGKRGVATLNQLMIMAQQGWQRRVGAIFGAGGKDLIGQDAATVRKSKAFQYTQKLRELQNAFYRSLLPVFEKLVEMMPDITAGLKFALAHIKEIVAVWLGSKLIRALGLVSTMVRGMQGGGGAVGAGFGAVTSRIGIYGAAFASAAWAGKKIGEIIAGRSVEAVKKEMAELEIELKAGRERLKRQNVVNKAVNRWLSGGARFSTVEGAEANLKARELLKGIIGKGGTLPVDMLIRDRGASGAKALAGSLKSRYDALLSALRQEVLRKIPKDKREGADVSPAMLEQAYPALATLRIAYETLDKRLADLIQVTSEGKNLKIFPQVTVMVPDPTAPGKRARVSNLRSYGNASREFVQAEETVHNAFMNPVERGVRYLFGL